MTGQRETLEQVVEAMDECARLLRSLRNPRIDAYCLAAFEGSSRGWLGRFERDVIDEELERVKEEVCDECGDETGDGTCATSADGQHTYVNAVLDE